MAAPSSEAAGATGNFLLAVHGLGPSRTIVPRNVQESTDRLRCRSGTLSCKASRQEMCPGRTLIFFRAPRRSKVIIRDGEVLEACLSAKSCTTAYRA
jgi:hypothetical protein